jgi:O-antigen/teichoic acid export membrane protein
MSLPRWRPGFAALSLLGVATAAGAGMVFLAQLLLARHLGAAEYGLFSSSLATITMIAPLAGFGLSQFRLKAYGEEGWRADRWLLPTLRFAAASTLLTMALVAAWALFGAPVDAATRTVLLALLVVIPGILAVDLVGSKLRLEERHGALAAWQVFSPAGRLAVAAALLALPGATAMSAAAGYCLVALATMVAAAPQVTAMVRGKMALYGHGARTTQAPEAAPGVRRLCAQAWPYGMAAILYPVFYQIGTVLLKYLSGDAEAGRFGVALAVMTAIYLLPATVYQKFLLARLHRWAAHDRPRFWRVHRQGSQAMAASGVAIGVLLVLLAPFIARVFGPDFSEVSTLLMVLALCVPIRFLSTSVGSALLTEGHMRYRVKAMALAAVVAVALNLALVPRLEAIGAAVATVLAEMLLLYLMHRGVRRIVR